jgi:hypothetical protein
MSTTTIATRVRPTRNAGSAGYGPGLAALAALWGVVSGVTLFLLVITFLPGHAGMGEVLQRVAGALPLDPQAWAGFVP